MCLQTLLQPTFRPQKYLIQGLYFGRGTADLFPFISYQAILTTRLPAFLMQYHASVIYPKLCTLRNVSSKVEIFTCVRAEISRAVCFFIPSSLRAPRPSYRQYGCIETKKRYIRHGTIECDHEKKLCVTFDGLQTTTGALQ